MWAFRVHVATRIDTALTSVSEFGAETAAGTGETELPVPRARPIADQFRPAARSTLFMLVAALASLDRIKAAYVHAIAHQYRFFSSGDACLIEPCWRCQR